MKTNSHSYIDNPNNENIKIYINGDFHSRDNAKISVFDSGFLLGDGVWESFRLHNCHLCFIDEHINRLINGASEISIDINKTKKELVELIKSKKYFFNGDTKEWSKIITEDKVENEKVWLAENIYKGTFSGLFEQITLIDKYKNR